MLLFIFFLTVVMCLLAAYIYYQNMLLNKKNNQINTFKESYKSTGFVQLLYTTNTRDRKEVIIVDENFEYFLPIPGIVYKDEKTQKLFLNTTKMMGYRNENDTPFIQDIKNHDFYANPTIKLLKEFFPFENTLNSVWLEIYASRVSSDSSDILINIKDITMKVHQDQDLLKFAFEDGLTGASNKLQLEKHFENKGFRYRHIMVVSITSFKAINEAYGFVAGDICLSNLKTRLDEFFTQYSESNYIIYRVSGDRFIVNFSITREIDTNFIEHLSSMMCNPFLVQDTRIRLDLVAGILKNYMEDTTLPDILKKLDICTHNARNAHKNIYVVDETLHTINNFRIDTLINNELTEDQVLPYIQPIYNFRTGALYGFEIFTRLYINNQEYYPNQFLDVASLTNKVSIIDMFVFSKTVKRFSELIEQKKIKRTVKLSFNLSTQTVISKEFKNFVMTVIEPSKLKYSNIVFELSDFSDKYISSIVKTHITELNFLGIIFGIDSFTMDSIRSNMVTENISTVKLSKEFLWKAAEDEKFKRHYRFVAREFRKGDVRPIAEGVETEEHLIFASRSGMDLAQGYLFSQPKSIEYIEEFIDKQTINISDIVKDAKEEYDEDDE